MLRKTAVLALALCFALQGAAQEGVYINGSDTLHYSYTPLPEQPQPQKRLSFPRRVVKYFEGSTRDRTFEKKIDFTFAGGPSYSKNTSFGIGLLAAAKKFDYTRELRFSTYATKWIRQSVGRCLAQHSGVIRVPTHTGEKMRKVLATQNRLTQELERPPTEAEIAESTGLTAEQVRKLLDLVPETCSLDAPTGEDGDTSLGGLLRDSTVEAPEKEVVRQELETTMQTLLDQLPERQRKLVSMRFGLEDGVCHSLDEIGREFGVSRERARQIEGQAMEKLRQMGMKQGLEDFLE